MRSIKEHISLIFPMVAILLGLEFFIAFDRTTKGYEESLKNSYSMLVVSKDEMDIDDFRAWDKHIYKVSEIEKSRIVKEVGLDLRDKDRYLSDELPNFYSIKLNKYLNTKELEQVKKNLLKSDRITRVESFDTLHNSNYGLFSSIKLAFRTFIFFMTVIGFFLIIKQMEVWHLLHSERMKIMDILGASLFLRSKALIVMALVDAIISAIIASIVFYLIQNSWVKGNHIAILEDNIDGLFSFNDVFTLIFASILIVLVAVVIVVLRVKEE